MFVFLPLLPTRELSHTSTCLPQESCFGIFLVTFSSPGCPHMSKKLLINDAHHNTFLSFPPLKEGLVDSLHICIFPNFTSLKRDFLGSCWWAPPLSSPRSHMFWSSCASHTELQLIHTLCFPGWLTSSFTWSAVHMVRAVSVTAWN